LAAFRRRSLILVSPRFIVCRGGTEGGEDGVQAQIEESQRVCGLILGER
jgi:hypothetical protein